MSYIDKINKKEKESDFMTKSEYDSLTTALCGHLRNLSLQISIAYERMGCIDTRIAQAVDMINKTMQPEWILDQHLLLNKNISILEEKIKREKKLNEPRKTVRNKRAKGKLTLDKL